MGMLKGGGRPREQGASGNLVRGLEAPIHGPHGSSRRQTDKRGLDPPKCDDVSGRPPTASSTPHPPPRGRKPAQARQASHRAPATPPPRTRSNPEFSRRHGVQPTPETDKEG